MAPIVLLMNAHHAKIKLSDMQFLAKYISFLR